MHATHYLQHPRTCIYTCFIGTVHNSDWMRGLEVLDASDHQDECDRATEMQRRLMAAGRGSMGWKTHKVHVYSLPLHPRSPEHNDCSSKGRKKQECCCCCCHNGCQHHRRVFARWDNYRRCFVPSHMDRDHNFGEPPMHYRYFPQLGPSPQSSMMVPCILPCAYLGPGI